MSSLNKITLLGTLEGDAELRVTNSGDSMLKLQLKVDRPARSDGMVSGHDVVDIIAWRQVAEENKGVSKGDIVFVEGKVVTRVVDEESGKKKWFTEVDARQCIKIQGQTHDMTASQTSSLEDMSEKEFESTDFDFNSQVDQVDPPKFSKELEADVPF
tara:strand:+ start:473 stop:943 length:471 start_codon:yes stop_codon:yes gene_type:complete